MSGIAQLHQLAQVFRVGADTAREIASFESNVSEDVERLARQADMIAAELENLANSTGGESGERWRDRMP